MTADLSGLRQRVPPSSVPPAPNLTAGASTTVQDANFISHPSGKRKHGRFIQLLRGFAFGVFFLFTLLVVHFTQWISAPFYFVNRDLFYSCMAMTKRQIGVTVLTITYWWSPSVIRISGDASVAGQIKQTPDGRVQFSFPHRLVLIANHQIYTDWLYLWWVGYANDPQMHGYLYIILKESIKYVPIIGPGMMFYGFIFLSRKMAVDQYRLAHRLQKFNTQHTGSDGKKYLKPMWLLLFPEGTNVSDNGRDKSAKWAEKIGVKDMDHVLLPRSTGMFFCLNELKDTVEYVYDCTVAYEGIPRGRYGEEFFTLSSTSFQGRPPKSVNFHWRRFRIADIPLDDTSKFELWLRERWYEKDSLMEAYMSTGRFPSSPMATEKGHDTYIETEVRTRYLFEYLQVFIVPCMAWFIFSQAMQTWHRLINLVA